MTPAANLDLLHRCRGLDRPATAGVYAHFPKAVAGFSMSSRHDGIVMSSDTSGDPVCRVWYGGPTMKFPLQKTGGLKR
jgi:hypothetical protein